MKKISYFIILISILLPITGCNEDFLERQPLDQLVTGNFLKTNEGLSRAVDACYSPLGEEGFNGKTIWMIGDGASDDAQPNGVDPTYIPIDDFTVATDNIEISNLWQTIYKMITLCNIVLDNADGATVSDDARNKYKGQAHFLRAYSYFMLVRIYGSVPLVLKVLSASSANLPRDPVDKIYEAIVNDLQKAANELPAKNQYTGDDIGRASKHAALGLLAKVYLTMGGCYNYMADADYGENIRNPEMYRKCADLCQEVIDSGIYNLLSVFADNFNKNNLNTNEPIFQIQFIGCSSRHGGGNMLQAFWAPWASEITGKGDGWGTHSPTKELFLAFSSNDLRLNETLLVPGVEHPELPVKDAANPGSTKPFVLQENYGRSGYACRKYVVGGGPGVCSMSAPNNTNILRYADILLMKAEVQNELGNTADAASTIDPIRQRAGLKPIDKNLNQDQMRDTILHERRLELALEQHRWFDLLRTGRALKVLTEHGKSISRERLLFPIPDNEIQMNPSLEQNKGY